MRSAPEASTRPSTPGLRPEPSDSGARLRSLDGLRGVAAAIVLLHHLSMTIPAVSDGYDSARQLELFSPAWWLVATPIKIFVAGPEFVLVFFVLSGFVLTLPPLKARLPGQTRRYDWSAFFPRRILRIGVPVVASMVLAYLVITVFPHPAGVGDGSWLHRQARPNTSVHNLLTETVLFIDPHPSVNPPLWSLTWEMWFSLLLPVVVLLALWSRRMPVLWGVAFAGISVFGYLAHVEAAMFLPAFALGALLGANGDRIRALVDRWRGTRVLRLVFVAIVVSGPLLSICYWLIRPVVGTTGDDLAMAMRVPGALLLVAAVAFWPPLGHVFAVKPLALLGAVSFSLYLVHSPIVVLFGLDFSGTDWWIGAVLSVVVSFALAIGMYLLVERPSRRLAGWVGRRLAAAVAAVTAPIIVAAELEKQGRRLQRHPLAADRSAGQLLR